MKRSRIILPLLAALLAAGCFKEVTYKTTYVLRPLVEHTSGDISVPLTEVRAFAYNVDTTQWQVASYDDALRGVITSRTDPQQRLAEPASVSEPYELEGTTGWLQLHLDRPSQMVVAVDPENRLYAYTQQVLVENLYDYYITLVFQPWREGFRYRPGTGNSNVWVYCNDFYEPPTYLECTIVPTVQSAEGGEAVAAKEVKAYAFAADTTLWYIASYQDALGGQITSKNDPNLKRENPNFNAYPQKETNNYVMKVSSEQLMVVVVDKTNSRYAYTQKVVELEGAPQTFPVLFRLWDQSWIAEYDGWQFINESKAPEPVVPVEPTAKSAAR